MEEAYLRNCVDYFCIYLNFLRVQENNVPRWNFAWRPLLKTSASTCEVVVPSYSNMTFYRILQLEW